MSDSLVRWERQSGVVTEPEDAASPDIGRKIERHRKKAIYRLDTYLSRQQYCLMEDEGFEVICHNRRASSAHKQQSEPRDLTTSRAREPDTYDVAAWERAGLHVAYDFLHTELVFLESYLESVIADLRPINRLFLRSIAITAVILCTTSVSSPRFRHASVMSLIAESLVAVSYLSYKPFSSWIFRKCKERATNARQNLVKDRLDADCKDELESWHWQALQCVMTFHRRQ